MSIFTSNISLHFYHNSLENKELLKIGTITSLEVVAFTCKKFPPLSINCRVVNVNTFSTVFIDCISSTCLLSCGLESMAPSVNYKELELFFPIFIGSFSFIWWASFVSSCIDVHFHILNNKFFQNISTFFNTFYVSI